MPKAMIITVGTGTRDAKDLAHGIAFSIRQQNPEFVSFVVTKESKNTTIPYILERLSLKEDQYVLKEIQDENDVERIYEECLTFIKELPYKPQDITADYTSGTKPMSSGLCMAAISLEVGSLSYVHGKREGGVTISGTERLMVLEPVRITVDAKMKMVVSLFNNYQFDPCLSIINGLKERIKVPEIQKELVFLEILSFAYSFWEKFDTENALKWLSELKDSPLLSQFCIKSQVERNKEALSQENQDNYSPMKVADLLENAKRRGEEGKYDDAVARLYRLMEFLAQYKLYKDHGGIKTSNLDLERLPSKELKEKYAQFKELSLHKAYELLSDMEDGVGKRFIQDEEIKKVLSIRNNSILAHGFNPIDREKYEKVLNLVFGYVEKTLPQIKELTEKVVFPKIRYSCQHYI